MKKPRFSFIEFLRPFLLLIVGCLVIASLFWFKLDDITPGISPNEQPTVTLVQSRSLSGRDILENPLYLPYKMPMYILEKLGLTGLLWIRSIGAMFGLISVLSFFYIAKYWHSTRVAFLGTVIFLTSSWLLHASRLASPETTYLLLSLLLLIGTRIEQGDHPFIMLSSATLLGSLLLYVPGLVWLIIPGAVWQRKRILDQFADVKKLWNILIPVGFLLLMLPLLYSLIANPELLPEWLGLGNNFSGIRAEVVELIKLPVQLLVISNPNPLITIGRIPVVDIAAGALAVIGVYFYTLKLRLDRSITIFTLLLLGSILAVVLDLQTLSIILPFFYLLSCGGIALLFHQWFKVFPRNPLARGIGIFLITAVVLSSSFYNLKHYFVAWPNAPQTKQHFNIEL